MQGAILRDHFVDKQQKLQTAEEMKIIWKKRWIYENGQRIDAIQNLE